MKDDQPQKKARDANVFAPRVYHSVHTLPVTGLLFLLLRALAFFDRLAEQILDLPVGAAKLIGGPFFKCPVSFVINSNYK